MTYNNIQGGGGLLYELSKKAMLTKNYKELDDTIRQRIPPYTYNNGEGNSIIYLLSVF